MKAQAGNSEVLCNGFSSNAKPAGQLCSQTAGIGFFFVVPTSVGIIYEASHGTPAGSSIPIWAATKSTETKVPQICPSTAI
jgi:hypothetical protein